MVDAGLMGKFYSLMPPRTPYSKVAERVGDVVRLSPEVPMSGYSRTYTQRAVAVKYIAYEFGRSPATANG